MSNHNSCRGEAEEQRSMVQFYLSRYRDTGTGCVGRRIKAPSSNSPGDDGGKDKHSPYTYDMIMKRQRALQAPTSAGTNYGTNAAEIVK